jgi:hypothetical protein
LQPTVGSQIQSLSVSLEHSCFEGLFQGLADKAEQIRIQKLWIPSLDWVEEDINALTQCITKVSSLRELDFHDDFLDFDGTLPDVVIACLKENGHIQSVSSNVVNELVHAYCERNQFLSKLLLESSAGGGSEERSGLPTVGRQDATPAKRSHSKMQGCGSSVDDEHADTSRSLKKHKSFLCPTLCQSAMEMPTTRLSLLSRTLLRLQESIAPTAQSESTGSLQDES